MTIDRPAGPLTETLWPHEWTSDGAGVVNIPTLEAGKHLLRTPDSTKPIEVNVPPLPAKRDRGDVQAGNECAEMSIGLEPLPEIVRIEKAVLKGE